MCSLDSNDECNLATIEDTPPNDPNIENTPQNVATTDDTRPNIATIEDTKKCSHLHKRMSRKN